MLRSTYTVSCVLNSYTSSSLSGTREMKSMSSLLSMKLGLRSFLVNLFRPQTRIMYL